MIISENNNRQITNDLDFVQTALPSVLGKMLSISNVPSLTVVKETAYPYSQIRIVEFQEDSGKTRRFYLKRINFPNKDRTMIEKNIALEQDMLLKLNKEMPKESVHLIAAFPDHCTIVTEECAGKMLDSIINSYQYWWLLKFKEETNEKLPYLCGKWLQRFHAVSLEPSHNLRPWYDFITGEMIWRTRQLSKMLPDYFLLFNTCNERFQMDMNTLGEKGPSHIYHADFAPHNIFVQYNRIQTIDFSGIRRGHGILDVVNFLSSIALRSENPLFLKSQNRKFCEAFLDGYGPINLHDPRIPGLLFVLQSVKRILTLANIQTSSNFGHAFIIKRNMKRYLDHLQIYAINADMQDITDPVPWPNFCLAQHLFSSNTKVEASQ